MTRQEAGLRGSLLRVRSYRIHLDLSRAGVAAAGPAFGSRTRIRFGCLRPGATTWVDLHARCVREVTLNGVPLTAGDAAADGRIWLPGLTADNELVVDGDCEFTTSAQGLHRFVDPVDQAVYVYTHLQSAHASRVFACFDQPDLKAPFEITVCCPGNWTVCANAPVSERQPGRPGSGLAVHSFARTPPISTYLVALVAGPLASWTAGGEPGKAAATRASGQPAPAGRSGLPLGIYARRSLADHVDPGPLFGYLRRGLSFYSGAFGMPYAFAKLDLCFVPEFNFGAMENAACIVAAETFVFDRAVTRNAHQRRCEMLLHELAHQWFGNLVTFRWWDDLWLNEAFATWASIHAQTQVTEFSDAWADFGVGKKAMAYALDQSPATHPVVTDVPDVDSVTTAFDGLTYYKGASVLRQLVARLGVGAFLEGVRRYLRAHAYGTATHTDLIDALQAGTDLDLRAWARQWLHASGLPEIRGDFAVDRAGRFSRFTLVQEPTVRTGAPPSHRLAIGVYGDGPDGRLVRTGRHELDITGLSADVPAMTGQDAGLLVLPNDGDLAYCRVMLDDRSIGVLTERIAHLTDPMARSLCWASAWEMVRARRLAARRYLSMVRLGLGTESLAGVVHRLLSQSATVLGTYTEQDWARQRGWPDFVDHLLGAIADPAASPGSRLAFTRAVADACLTAGQLHAVRRWLDGTDPTVSVDTDLRWRLARALIAHDAAPASLIDDLAAADPSAAGQRRADQLRATVPSAEAKEWAWRRILDPSVPAANAAALASGFAHPAQHRLLAPFAERYAPDVALIWRRGPAEASLIPVMRLFPSWSVSARTLTSVGRLIASGLPAALRAPVSQRHAELALALALTSFDSGSAAQVTQA